MTTRDQGCFKALGAGEWWVRGAGCRVGCADLGFAMGKWVCVLGEDEEGGMLERSVCLNLSLLAEKVMSASVSLECVLFQFF